MKYLYKIDNKFVELVISHFDENGNAILIQDTVVYINAHEYVYQVQHEADAYGCIGQGAENAQEYFREKYRGKDVVFKIASDEFINLHLVKDFNYNASESGGEEVTLNQVKRWLYD